MISKAKILFYGMFRRPKICAPTEKKLSFANKIVLLQVRRFKKLRDIPPTLSMFDWNESKSRAVKQYKFIGVCLLVYLVFDFITFLKMLFMKRAERLYAERKAKNLPDFPRYVVLGDNPDYDLYEDNLMTDSLEKMKIK